MTVSALPANVNKPNGNVSLRKWRRPHCFKPKGKKTTPTSIGRGFLLINLVT